MPDFFTPRDKFWIKKKCVLATCDAFVRSTFSFIFSSYDVIQLTTWVNLDKI